MPSLRGGAKAPPLIFSPDSKKKKVHISCDYEFAITIIYIYANPLDWWFLKMPYKLSNNENIKTQASKAAPSSTDQQAGKTHTHQINSLSDFVDNSDMATADNDLLVTMFGNFSIRQNNADDEVAVLSKLGGRSRRLWILIAYLIVNREKGVSASELIDLLWPDVDTSNPQTRLQNNISRARVVLDNGSFDDSKDLIRFEDGLYWWAPGRQTILDVDIFEKAVRSFGPDIDESRIDYALELCDLYQGDFLAQATDETWCTNLNIYYRSLFTNFALKLLETLKMTDRISDIKRLCLRVIDIDPTIEEFNISLMEALIAEGNPNKAIDHYEHIKTVFHDIYGVQVSQEMEIQRNRALEVMYGNKVSKQAILDYFNDFNVDDGAFLCNTLTFQQIVQLHIRMLHRNGDTSQLVAIEFTSPDQSNSNVDKSIANMKRLEHVIQKTLRSGDPFTKMGRDIFLMLLSGANPENGEMVTHRIIDNYHEEFPFSKVNFKTWQFDLKDL